MSVSVVSVNNEPTDDSDSRSVKGNNQTVPSSDIFIRKVSAAPRSNTTDERLIRTRAVLSSSRVLVVKSELIRRRESTERPFLFRFFSFHLKTAAPATNIILICAALYIMLTCMLLFSIYALSICHGH